VIAVLAQSSQPVISGAQRAGGMPIDRLPANAYAVVVWHGQAAVAKGLAVNNLVRLWNDPEFLTTRKAFAERFAGEVDKAGKGNSLTQADLDLVFDVLANPGMVGAAGTPDLGKLLDSGPGAKSKESDFFLVWDMAGKQAQWQKIDALFEKRATAAPAVTSVTLGGVAVRRKETPESVSFRADVGSWRVEAGRQSVMADLISRLQGGSPGGSFAQSPLYQAARRFSAENAVAEFFVKIPDVSTMSAPPVGGFDVAAVLRGLHMERMQGFVGSIGLSGAGTQVRTALIGDTSPGSLFDYFGENVTTFATLPAAPSGFSYSAARMNLGALYQTIRGALKGALTPDQFASVEMAEGMVMSETGMPIGELLGMIEEFANITPFDLAATDFTKVMYAVRLRKPEALLSLLRTAAGSSIASDTVEGNVTYLALPMPGLAIHMAFTPQLLIVGPSADLVRQAVGRAAATGVAPGSLAADTGFQQSRARFPTALSAFGYSDMSKFPWMALLENPLVSAPTSAPFRQLPAVLSRYLKTTSSATWKAAGGVFFEVRID
jgi:hypothetical protein